MNVIIEALGKPSTWRGIIGIATALGMTISPELSLQIIAAGTGVIGLINLIRVEKKVS